ncbi:LysE/ArgO family amino acid transporter [Paenibacillus cremeus]|uniref:Amino acid transporter n=1 Tax=Paenibacillus cremeus TaxID=2163881 RepID=A0A559KA44_9BACL|nr:LysE/ArgO family amino acid transporter [Paenibacillus cremeus]TVY08994.1 amino acid transporter [Paenibacillus cremeus]
MLTAFIHGFLLAVGLIVPLGAQNMFIFSQGATARRFLHVLPIVITAALCDSLLILLAIFGVSLIVLRLVWTKWLLMAGGVVFLAYMGWVTWRRPPSVDEPGTERVQMNQWGKIVSFTLMVSLLNPHAILDTVGVIGTSSLSYTGAYKTAFTAACMLVSWSWFLLLAVAGRWIGMKDRTGRFTAALNKGSALVMWAAAVYLVLSFL